MCPGGEGTVLKIVGSKGLAGSNPVHGVVYRGSIPSIIFLSVFFYITYEINISKIRKEEKVYENRI